MRQLPFTPEWLFFPEPWVWALLALPLLPLAWVLWLHRSRRPALRYSSLDGLRALAGPWPRRARLLIPLLTTIALACLIVAVARPQRADESSRIFARGIAIQMVIDTSSSMSDDDLSPRGKRMTRLDVVKDVFRRFVMGDDKLPGRPNDLIGMIRFARYADSAVPLTLDRRNLIEMLAQLPLTPENSPDNGTAIGDALALAVERLKDLKRTAGSGEQLEIESRIVILLTDGENNLGEFSPTKAGELAATFGIKVYTIAAGTGAAMGGRHIPIDDSDLRDIAAKTGGKHFSARDAKALEQVYEEIDKLERTRVEERAYTRYGDLAGPWLIAALAALALRASLDATILRKAP